jgi:hypothetical protein
MGPFRIHQETSFDFSGDFLSRIVDFPPAEGAQAFSSSLDSYQETGPCNGHFEFCDRPYNKMMFAGTHNSFSAIQEDFWGFNANQRSGLATQLEDGIRVLLLDVYGKEGETYLCHHFCVFGSKPHLEALGEIKNFLETHPREVLTILYEDHVPPEAIAADFLRSGLVDYVYTHPAGEPWPTLGEMIARGTRLVVTAENAGPPPLWLHSMWQIAWDNPFRNFSPEQFRCDLNRGSRSNGLFLLNHWVNNRLDFPSEEQAAEVNRLEALYPRVLGCIQESRRIPNFIAVDYYEHGDLFPVLDLLNGVSADPEIAVRAVESLSQLDRAPDFLIFDGNLAEIVHNEPAPQLVSLALPPGKKQQP